MTSALERTILPLDRSRHELSVGWEQLQVLKPRGCDNESAEMATTLYEILDEPRASTRRCSRHERVIVRTFGKVRGNKLVD